MNKETAITQKGLNAENINTPQGTRTYNQIGTWPDGTPRYEVTEAYSPEQQKLYDQGVANQQQIGQIAGQQIGKVGGILGTPVQIGNEATEARLMELGSKRLDPRFAQERQTLESDLFNRGIRPGSEAYARATGQFDQGKNDAYNQLLLGGRAQAVQESLAERNQPINEITALLSGSQVSQPNFTGGPQVGVAPVDYTGLVNQQYQAEQAASQSKMGGLGSIMGSLGGWGMMALMMSDRRLKTNIRRTGTHDKGFGVYDFRYVWDEPGTVRTGYMADEVEQVMPEVVSYNPDGYALIDYARV